MDLLNELNKSLENVDAVTYATRQAICHGCPYDLYDSVTDSCTSCDCFITIKAKLKSQECPKGFWK